MKTLICLLLLSVAAAGQSTGTKPGIYIDCTCNDAVGSQFATALRDAIASSPRYKLAASESYLGPDGKTRFPYFIMHIVTIDDAADKSGVSSAIAVSYSLNDIFLGNNVQICGRDMVKHCASGALATADETLTVLFKLTAK